ncbi:Rpn family recombination-promoting nuclease/putative transposase [Pantoea coffeiphila]|uniref:Rpn family recombination-promoting nuclease/putative transposase n=1 Tax=Pantoea coffeiphila TaxID=1465635 RepID=UPI001960CF27|nr:Rpn family recombination-promoting nuclease/putative transposase [Pantoea coffeiphila]MBM7341430.1 putative transposase/invertase (TIGR01784 family) [Pantoea coffeiphila]
MTRTTSVPHDAVFKTFLSHPDTARDFIALHLPEQIYALCDLSTLKLESGSFVEENLRAFYSDVLYSVQTTSGQGYIHILIEHQSSPDRHMAFRLMRYAIAAMQRHLDAGHSRLPLVIPFLFYNGRRSPYPYSTNWLQEFYDPGMAEKLYREDFPLIDVTVIPDDDIMHHRSMAALTLLQKHIHQRDLTELLDRLCTVLIAGYLTGQQLVSLINYLVQTGEAPDASAFVRKLAQRMPQHKDGLMTIAQQLEQIGVKKGIKKGLKKGILLGEEQGVIKGKREAALTIARSLLTRGMDADSVLAVTGLMAEDLEKLPH